MTAIPAALENLLAAWNETDVARIAGHLKRAVTDDVVFVDPNYAIVGRAAFEKMVADFRRKYPNARSIRASDIDRHHDRARYYWRVFVDAKNFVDGMDCVELADDGRVRRCDGFFGRLKIDAPAYG